MVGQQVGCRHRYQATVCQDHELHQAGGLAIPITEGVDPSQVEVGIDGLRQRECELDFGIVVLERWAFQPVRQPLEEVVTVLGRSSSIVTHPH